MSTARITAAGPLNGRVRVPGDKSVSHRAVLFAAMSDGSCRISGALDSADVRATVRAVEALGAGVVQGPVLPWGVDLVVNGWGQAGPMQPSGAIDCGNSGTTARLLPGVMAGWPLEVTLRGDDSLSRRPMARIIEPLTMMGASFTAEDGARLPMTVRGGELHAISYDTPVASAQVKSAILLAGTRAQGRTVVREPTLSRDHTERLLPAFGVGVGHDQGDHACWVEGPATLMATDVEVPGDPSSAAFVAGAAVIVSGSYVEMPDVALNPTRTGFARVLEEMGARIVASPERASGAEPIGTLIVDDGAGLNGVVVGADRAPALIDEVPLLAVVATQARGTTRFEGVGELRVKETDRLAAVADGLARLGAEVRAGEDWLEVDGPAALNGCEMDSLGDHRLAMAWAVAGLVAQGGVTVSGWEAIDVSYPGFGDDLASLGAEVSLVEGPS